MSFRIHVEPVSKLKIEAEIKPEIKQEIKPKIEIVSKPKKEELPPLIKINLVNSSPQPSPRADPPKLKLNEDVLHLNVEQTVLIPIHSPRKKE
jgi:hypothetical protein